MGKHLSVNFEVENCTGCLSREIRDSTDWP